MRRFVRLGVAAVAGLLAGGGAMLVVQGSDDLTEPAGPVAAGRAPAVTVAAEPPTVAPTSEPTGPEVVLAWTWSGLPAGFAAAVDALPATAATTVVRGDRIALTRATAPDGRPVGPPVPAGMTVPLDAIAIDAATYAAVVPPGDRATFRGLGPGEAIVGATSARLREVESGARLTLAGGVDVTVAGVVDDQLVGAAELVVDVATGATLGIDTDRYVLATAASSAAETASAIRQVADPSVPLRVRRPGETPYLRSSDAVLPQARIKDVFGEFAYTEGAGRELVQDPAWVEANIVTEEVPILGRVQCHRALIPALRGAMEELAARNLAGLVESYDGCYNPRLIATGGSISRHAWGAAVDLNFSGNPTNTESIQDERLVATMERWGFGSGDQWLVPDPGHFEYVAPPSP